MAREQMERSKTGTAPVVLVVDDDLSYLDKLQRALRDIYTVHTTTSGVEAIHLIKGLPEVNVLVVNEDLPRMKGTELLRFLNEIFKNSDAIIKILLTAAPSNGTTIDLASYGRIDCCLAKPEDPAAIRRKISFLIAQRSREKRTSMRVAIDGTKDIRIETGPMGEVKLINLSENGMFLKTLTSFPEGSAMPLNITLPDGRLYTLNGRVVRQDNDQGGVAVAFESLDDASRLSLLQFMSDYVAIRDLDELKLRYPFLRTDEMVLFADSVKIESLMREALQRRVEVGGSPGQVGQSRDPRLRRYPAAFRMPPYRREARRQVQDLGLALRLLPDRLRDLQLRDHGLAHLARRPDPCLPLPAGHVLLGKKGREEDQPGRGPPGRDPPAASVRAQAPGPHHGHQSERHELRGRGGSAGPAQRNAARNRLYPRRRETSLGRDGRGPPRHPRRGRGRTRD